MKRIVGIGLGASGRSVASAEAARSAPLAFRLVASSIPCMLAWQAFILIVGALIVLLSFPTSLNGQADSEWFINDIGDKISLYDNRLNSPSMYGFGVEGSTLYYKSYNYHRWYVFSNADNGASDKMQLSSSKLHVNGNIEAQGWFLSDTYRDRSSNALLWRDENRIALGSGNPIQFVSIYSGAVERIRISEDGDVGIGTTTPGNKLEVNGTIRSKEVIVESTGWPDYVFEDGYALPSLSEVESYIEENGHLPGVEPASAVSEGGQSLGAMQRQVMRKIEELTLYIIQKDKDLAELRKEKDQQISKLQSELQQIRELVD